MNSIISLSGSKRFNEDDDDENQGGSYSNRAKKIRTDRISDDEVSRVVHIRSLPTDVTESEVIQIGLNYGKVTNLLMLKGKNQAFLEMENENAAKNMVDSCSTSPPTVRQRITYVQYSTHKELKTDNSPNQVKTQSLLKAMQQSEGGKNHVLRIVVENMVYPITLDILHKIFSKFGVIVKGITFNKNNQFQALLQMGNELETEAAKLALDGQNIYNGCCTLRIEYSKLSCLNVKYNNDKSRDYTQPNLSSGVGGGSSSGSGLLGAPSSSLLSKTSSLLPEHLQAQIAAVFQQSHLGASRGRREGMRHSYTDQYDQMPFSSRMGGMNSQHNQSPVLLVSNLDEEKVTTNSLFTLFGVYGDVIRVKILFQKRSTAMVQMIDHSQAQTARTYLDGVHLFGKQMRIVTSKHNHVQMPRDGQDSLNLSEDFSNSPLHRFKKPGSKNFNNIFPPSNVLHLSNIPQEVTEDSLLECFNKHGTVTGFKFFQSDRRMALVQLSNLDEAIICLVMLHNYQLSETNHLRVSFSSKGHL